MALGGELVAPEIPARRAGNCGSGFCYVRASASDPLAFAVTEPPEHGTVTVSGAGATYTPAAGFTGEDSFSYTATDVRGLTSKPATVKLAGAVTVTAPQAAPAPLVMTAPARAALSSIRVRRSGARYRLELQASGPALLSARLERRSRGRRTVRALRARRVVPGATRVAIGQLRPGRYRVGLRLDGRPAGSASFSVG